MEPLALEWMEVTPVKQQATGPIPILQDSYKPGEYVQLKTLNLESSS